MNEANKKVGTSTAGTSLIRRLFLLTATGAKWSINYFCLWLAAMKFRLQTHFFLGKILDDLSDLLAKFLQLTDPDFTFIFKIWKLHILDGSSGCFFDMFCQATSWQVQVICIRIISVCKWGSMFELRSTKFQWKAVDFSLLGCIPVRIFKNQDTENVQNQNAGVR